MAHSNDVGRSFADAAKSAPYLEREEERSLAERWKSGRDTAALHRLAASHMRLDPSDQTIAQVKAVSPVVAYGEIVDALPMPAAVLNTAGFVVTANPALAERLERPRSEVIGEPLLLWIGRASERSAFGRAFLGLRQRSVHHSFSLELGSLHGPPALVRACKMTGDHVLVTCEPVSGERAPETEIGGALTRGLEALDHGLLLLDHLGVVVHANPAARDLFGAAAVRTDLSSGPAGLVGRSLLERADPDGARALSQALTVAPPATGAASSTCAASTAIRSPSSCRWPPAAARAPRPSP